MFEGMPTSVLEALCFGLPIICSKVGAIPEIFEQKNMGYMVYDKNNHKDYVNRINQLMENKDLMVRMSNYNRKVGCSKYLASKRVLEIEKEYKKLFD